MQSHWVAVFILFLVGIVRAQESSNAAQQSPRQAALDMLAGDDAAFKKHLTLEMQAKIDAQLKGPSPAKPAALQAIEAAKAAGMASLEKFDSGPILISFNNAKEHERVEFHVDGDELRGEHNDEDIMLLSVHLFRNGEEQDLPFGLRFLLGWKHQQGIWRLNELTVSERLPVGDPRILDQSWWTPPVIGPLAAIVTAPQSTPSPTAGPPADNRPRMSVVRSLRLIGLAENIYANKHPETGFTCSISELVEIGRGMEDGEPYKFMDPDFAGGVYNGYKFSFSGCTGKPAKAFRVAAEPLSGTGRAYCSDTTHELHASDDGHAATCLASRKPVLH